MTYEEQLQDLIIKAWWRKTNLYNSIIVFDIERDNRRKIFYQYLEKTSWRKFQKAVHKVGDDHYDYVLFDSLNFTPLKLYEALKQHNGKILIFDNEMVLSKKGLIGIIEGGVCNNPETSDKWDVQPEGKPPFMFKGSIIILTGLRRDDCEKKEKLHYLMRDCLKV
jgi:hypothetical protein